MTSFEERRRSPRVRIDHHAVSVATSTRVRVLDISLGGLLLASDAAVPAGMGRVTIALPGGRISSRVSISHQSCPEPGFYHVGATFVEMSTESRHNLEQFLAKTTR